MSYSIKRRTLPSADVDLPDDLHPVLRRVYAARSVACADDYSYSLQQLLPPSLLGGLTTAAELLLQVMQAGRRILIVGDFDADGATSCALCVRALHAMGAADVQYLVPSRFEFGYGLTPGIVEVAAQRKPALIMTVDNGISSVTGVAAARERGIQVLITDHHLPGTELPDADAIVNPNLPGDTFPSKALAGVGVAFYVMLALRARLRGCGWFEQRAIAEPNLADLLDLVALGTVADVVPLDRNNRTLVRHGLQRIRTGRGVPGITALLRAANRNPANTVAEDLGFFAGPRLNAAGRLDDMSVGIECLLTDDESAAHEMALQLDALNRDRREIESDMQARALAAIKVLDQSAERLPTGLCLYDADWHQGVVGILAARIRERFHRPVVAFARGDTGEIKGSARSVPGLHIRDVLDAVATRHPGMIRKFGGHAMAAGLTLAEEDYEVFSDAFNTEVSRHLSADDLGTVIWSDGQLSENELTLDTAQLLRDAGPWGQGFPVPVFDDEFEIVSQRVVGERHLKLSLKPVGSRRQIDGIAFNTAALPETSSLVRMAYRLEVNEFRGTVSPQLQIEHIETGAAG